MLAHERLDVYHQAVTFASWAQDLTESLPPKTPAIAQLERASTSIPLNIAEGNAKSSYRDRARYWQIALGSTFECAAVLDVLAARGLLSADHLAEGKETLERVTAMLLGLLKALGTRVAH